MDVGQLMMPYSYRVASIENERNEISRNSVPALLQLKTVWGAT